MNTLTPHSAKGALADASGPEHRQLNLPITFRLPRSGERDPYFGLSRSWFYAAEADGRIRMIRLREKGKSRGTTLIATSEILNLIN